MANQYTVDQRNKIEIWHVQSGHLQYGVGEEGPYKEVAFSPDGQLLLVQHPKLRLSLWDNVTGECLATKPAVNCSCRGGNVSFSPGGRFVLIMPFDVWKNEAPVIFWEVATRTERARFGSFPGIPESQNAWWLKGLPKQPTFSSLSTWQFSRDGKCFTWSRWPADGKHIIQQMEITADNAFLLSPERRWEAESITVSPDCETVVTVKKNPASSSEEMQLWDLASGQAVTRPCGHSDSCFIFRVEFSPTGRFLAACTSRGFDSRKWHVWDIGAVPAEVGVYLARPVFSPKERWIVTTEGNGPEVWDAGGRGKHFTAHRENDHASRVYDGGRDEEIHSTRAQFSADDRWLVTSGMSARYSVNPAKALLTSKWNNISGTESYEVCRLWDVEHAQEVEAFSGCSRAEFSPDGQTLLVVEKDTIRLYDMPLRRPWGLGLMLTVAAWGLILLACWFVKNRFQRWKRLHVGVRCNQSAQLGASPCPS